MVAMGRGIYSALGRWPEELLPEMRDLLAGFGAAIDRGATESELAAVLPAVPADVVIAAVRAIRMFEARVGRSCGLVAERVSTPNGPGIEIGNRDHAVFPAHVVAAEVVARTLVPILEALGATGAFWFTID
jgi:hypothetical protein